MAQQMLDLFSRTVSANSSGWGSMSDGVNAWSVTGSTGSWSVSSGTATVTSVAASGNAFTQPSGGKTLYAMELFCTISASSTADIFGVVFCGTDTTYANAYAVFLDAGTTIFLAKQVGGTQTTLKSASFSYSINTFYNLRIRVLANHSILAKIWATTAAEPNTFQIIASDTTYTTAGLYGYLFAPTATSQNSKVQQFYVLDYANVDVATADESTLLTEKATPVDTMTVAEALLMVEMALALESATIGETGNNIAMTMPADITDAPAVTETMQTLVQVLPIDQASISESSQFTGLATSSDGLTPGEATLLTECSIPVDALTAADVGNAIGQLVGIDVANVADSTIFLAQEQFVDAQTTQEQTTLSTGQNAIDNGSVGEQNLLSEEIATGDIAIPNESGLIVAIMAFLADQATPQEIQALYATLVQQDSGTASDTSSTELSPNGVISIDTVTPGESYTLLQSEVISDTASVTEATQCQSQGQPAADVASANDQTLLLSVNQSSDIEATGEQITLNLSAAQVESTSSTEQTQLLETAFLSEISPVSEVAQGSTLLALPADSATPQESQGLVEVITQSDTGTINDTNNAISIPSAVINTDVLTPTESYALLQIENVANVANVAEVPLFLEQLTNTDQSPVSDLAIFLTSKLPIDIIAPDEQPLFLSAITQVDSGTAGEQTLLTETELFAETASPDEAVQFTGLAAQIDALIGQDIPCLMDAALQGDISIVSDTIDTMLIPQGPATANGTDVTIPSETFALTLLSLVRESTTTGEIALCQELVQPIADSAASSDIGSGQTQLLAQETLLPIEVVQFLEILTWDELVPASDTSILTGEANIPASNLAIPTESLVLLTNLLSGETAPADELLLLALTLLVDFAQIGPVDLGEQIVLTGQDQGARGPISLDEQTLVALLLQAEIEGVTVSDEWLMLATQFTTDLSMASDSAIVDFIMQLPRTIIRTATLMGRGNQQAPLQGRGNAANVLEGRGNQQTPLQGRGDLEATLLGRGNQEVTLQAGG